MMAHRFCRLLTLAALIVTLLSSRTIAGPPGRDEGLAALRRAVVFFHEHVSVEGGYVWRYSADLEKREGEGRVGPRVAWVQPPGTPFVGEALLDAYLRTGLKEALVAARSSAELLVRAQLHSGGWPYRIELEPAERGRFAYRVDGSPSRKARSYSVLDDDTTQAAIRFLVRFDEATGFREERVHEAVGYALDRLLAAQFANGGFSQVFEGPAEPRPVSRASYSDDGEYSRVKEYWRHYTLNDNLMSTVVDTLLLAARVYKEPRFRRAALAAGDFLLAAQMPDPQPGWAQQYDQDMRPTWARKFEPPAISGGEGQSVLGTLLDLFEATGERRFLEPVPRAIAYYRSSLLPDGRLARFYELRTNRPLYFTRDYELTHSDADLPTHYAFRVSSRLDALDARYRKLSSLPQTPADGRPPAREKRGDEVTPAEARRLIDALDTRGAWVEDGTLRFHGGDDETRRIIDPRTFAGNLGRLARYVERRSP